MLPKINNCPQFDVVHNTGTFPPPATSKTVAQWNDRAGDLASRKRTVGIIKFPRLNDQTLQNKESGN